MQARVKFCLFTKSPNKVLSLAWWDKKMIRFIRLIKFSPSCNPGTLHQGQGHLKEQNLTRSGEARHSRPNRHNNFNGHSPAWWWFRPYLIISCWEGCYTGHTSALALQTLPCRSDDRYVYKILSHDGLFLGPSCSSKPPSKCTVQKYLSSYWVWIKSVHKKMNVMKVRRCSQ